jgi:hypothetical protein
MNKLLPSMGALSIFLATAGMPAAADEALQPGMDAFDAFNACYKSVSPPKKIGEPVLTIDVVVTVKPKQEASGTGKVEWPSVGPAFTPIDAPISGPWYWMCTNTSCAFRFDFSSAPGAPGLKGMLVAPNWGEPGTFVYEFEGGPGEVKQDAVPCD